MQNCHLCPETITAQRDPHRWDIEQLIDDHERVPVTAIELSEPHVDTFLNDAFRRIAIRMSPKGSGTLRWS